MSRTSFVIVLAVMTVLLQQLKCDPDEDESKKEEKKIAEAQQIANEIMIAVFTLFDKCMDSSMPEQKFLTDDLQSYIYNPARTTIGFAAKYTSHRKFFANMLQSTEYKEMLDEDIKVLRNNVGKKMKFCNDAIMDQDLLQDFYEREVDQSKL